jgi:hypothetical protein
MIEFYGGPLDGGMASPEGPGPYMVFRHTDDDGNVLGYAMYKYNSGRLEYVQYRKKLK